MDRLDADDLALVDLIGRRQLPNQSLHRVARRAIGCAARSAPSSAWVSGCICSCAPGLEISYLSGCHADRPTKSRVREDTNQLRKDCVALDDEHLHL
jgi:hypothetical protein